MGICTCTEDQGKSSENRAERSFSSNFTRRIDKRSIDSHRPTANPSEQPRFSLSLSLSLDGNPGVSTLNLATASRYFAGVAKSFPLGRLNWKQLDREIFRYCFIVHKNGCLQPGHPPKPRARQPSTLDPALSIDESYRREMLSRFSRVVFTVNNRLLFPTLSPPPPPHPPPHLENRKLHPV